MTDLIASKIVVEQMATIEDVHLQLLLLKQDLKTVSPKLTRRLSKIIVALERDNFGHVLAPAVRNQIIKEGTAK